MKTKSKLHTQLESRAIEEQGNKERNGWYYSYFEDFIAQEGKVFESSPLTVGEQETIMKALVTSNNTKAKECFFNAQTLVMSDKSGAIEYWEGFTSSFGLPILHGFNVIGGKVVDITHKLDGKHIMGDFGTEKEYIGVQFNIQLSKDRIKSGKDCTSFIDNWKEGWPVLHEKWDK